ncbi:leucyl/phenylalanyl-tRNA--protein transferase [mine drainage metagenome]|uniref:Leucyl/phenylalanyl-tRNA--protein transferase n=1 Tax=mine drainage metagenome TaxID=410659 RepID=A0A1J5RNP8_9ZZZZ
MALYALNESIWFPPVEEALPDGLLAMGGDLSAERILLAYKQGIFPWYDGDIPLWWCPNPRFVLFPDELKISKSMKALIKKDAFEFRINSSFAEVIHNCKETKREGQDGTWIKDDVEAAYINLHKMGFAHSAEAWKDGKLVGGLYGIRLGKVFFGESMFSKESNASKFAFIKYVEQLKTEGVVLIDCQIYTEHLESLGAKMIMRQQFTQLLQHIV